MPGHEGYDFPAFWPINNLATTASLQAHLRNKLIKCNDNHLFHGRYVTEEDNLYICISPPLHPPPPPPPPPPPTPPPTHTHQQQHIQIPHRWNQNVKFEFRMKTSP